MSEQEQKKKNNPTELSRREFIMRIPPLLHLVRQILMGQTNATDLPKFPANNHPKPLEGDVSPAFPDDELRFSQQVFDRFQEIFGDEYKLVRNLADLADYPELQQNLTENERVIEPPTAIQVKLLHLYLDAIKKETNISEYVHRNGERLPLPIIFLTDASFHSPEQPFSEYLGLYDFNENSQESAILLDATRGNTAFLDFVLVHELGHRMAHESEGDREAVLEEIRFLIESAQDLVNATDPTQQTDWDLVSDKFLELMGQFPHTAPEAFSPIEFIFLYLLLAPARNKLFESPQEPSAPTFPINAGRRWFNGTMYDELYLAHRENPQDFYTSDQRTADFVERAGATTSMLYGGTNKMECIAVISQVVAQHGLAGFRQNFKPGLVDFFQTWAHELIIPPGELSHPDFSVTEFFLNDPVRAYYSMQFKKVDFQDSEALSRKVDEVAEFLCERIVKLVLTRIWQVPQEKLATLAERGYILFPQLSYSIYLPNSRRFVDYGARVDRDDVENMRQILRLYDELP